MPAPQVNPGEFLAGCIGRDLVSPFAQVGMVIGRFYPWIRKSLGTVVSENPERSAYLLTLFAADMLSGIVFHPPEKMSGGTRR